MRYALGNNGMYVQRGDTLWYSAEGFDTIWVISAYLNIAERLEWGAREISKSYANKLLKKYSKPPWRK